MATSGSYDYSLTGATIILEALELLGAHDVGETVDSNDQASALRSLNIMIKAWRAEGIGLWKNVNGNVFLADDGYYYDLGPSGDNCSVAVYKTELAVAGAASDSTITVDSDDNMTDGDAIGTELTDGTLQWTTINGTPSSDVVTLTAALASAAAIDNHVYNYTTLMQRPTEIVEARLVAEDGNERPLKIISRDEYMRIPDKTSTGSAVMVYYDPLMTDGRLYVWPACDDVKEYIKFTAKIQFEDFDATTNTPDFPQEWLLTLAWNLAVILAPKFGIKLDPTFIALAAGMKATVSGSDREDTSVYFSIRER